MNPALADLPGADIYPRPRYRWDPDEERMVRVPAPGCSFCADCGDEAEVDDEDRCERCAVRVIEGGE